MSAISEDHQKKNRNKKRRNREVKRSKWSYPLLSENIPKTSSKKVNNVNVYILRVHQIAHLSFCTYFASVDCFGVVVLGMGSCSSSETSSLSAMGETGDDSFASASLWRALNSISFCRSKVSYLRIRFSKSRSG